MLKNTIFYVILLGLSLSFVCSTLSKKSPKGKPKELKLKQEKPNKGPQNYTVFAKNLITKNPDVSDIIINHAGFFREVDEYNFDGIVLGYITPWNNHGYDVAKIFGNKFTHISPVWLQSFKDGDYNYKLAGTHDIDIQWISDVRNAGRERNLKIVPRVVFEDWTGLDFTKVITERDELKALTKSLIKNAKYYKFDGYVIEVFPQLATRITFEALVEFLHNFADELASEKLETILVIPPKRGNQELFNKKHFDALYDHFTAFSLMTYDFSTPLKPGPNSPITWMEQCVSALTTDFNKRKKILTGMNFYGNHYSMEGGVPILGRDYIKLLKTKKGIMEFEPEYDEHFFEYRDENGQHIIFYPTLYSVNTRIDKAKKLGTGISIWELGQGLDYFYDLL